MRAAAPSAVSTLDFDARGFLLRPSNVTQVNIYDTLVDFAIEPGPDGTKQANQTKVVGKLAESWTSSADGLTWTFKLKQGVKSHFGNELTSEDIVWTHKRGIDAKNINTFLNGLALLGPDSVKAVDKYTVSFTTSTPSPLFLKSRAVYAAAIIDSTEAKKHVTAADPAAAEWLAKNACGFGPYKVASWVEDQAITLEARADYHGSKPKVGRIVYQSVPASANRLAQLIRGDLDVTEEPTLDEADKARTDPGTKLVSLVANNLVWLHLNHQAAPFTDVKVRQAFATAVPYDTIVKDVYKGLARASKSVVPENIPGTSSDGWSYATDAQKARTMLTAAGVSGPLQINLVIPSASAEMEQVALAMRTAMQPAGIQITIDKAQPDQYATRLREGQFQAILNNTSRPVVPDALYVFKLFWTTKSISNYGKIAVPEIDALVDKAGVELDENKRLALLKDAQRIANEQVAVVPILINNQNVPMRKNVTGYTLYPDLYLRFSEFDKS